MEKSPVRLAIDHRGERIGDRGTGKRRPAGAHLEHHAAERPDIRALVDVLTARLFRAHVCRGADDDAESCAVPGDRGNRRCRGGCERADRFGQPEVEDLDGPLGCDLDVGRFQITMDDAAIVRRLERLGDLASSRDDLVDRQRTGRQALRERRPLDQFEHERGDVAAFLDAVDRADVRVIQRGERSRLLLEPRAAVRVVRDRIGQHLDRDRTSQPGIVRAINLSHPAGAEQALDAERPQLAARRESSDVFWHREYRRIAKRSGLVVRREHRVDRGPERSVMAAGVGQVRVAPAPIKGGGRREDAGDITPALGFRVALLGQGIIPETGSLRRSG